MSIVSKNDVMSMYMLIQKDIKVNLVMLPWRKGITADDALIQGQV